MRALEPGSRAKAIVFKAGPELEAALRKFVAKHEVPSLSEAIRLSLTMMLEGEDDAEAN